MNPNKPDADKAAEEYAEKKYGHKERYGYKQDGKIDFLAGASWQSSQSGKERAALEKIEVDDLQNQVREHIKQHDLFDWHEALSNEEMVYLENLLLTFAPMFSPGSIGFEKTVRPYLQALSTDVGEQDELCSRCGKEKALELHSCPYKSEINDDDEFSYNCCESCTHECAMDI